MCGYLSHTPSPFALSKANPRNVLYTQTKKRMLTSPVLGLPKDYYLRNLNLITVRFTLHVQQLLIFHTIDWTIEQLYK